jgi:hypothetical protein
MSSLTTTVTAVRVAMEQGSSSGPGMRFMTKFDHAEFPSRSRRRPPGVDSSSSATRVPGKPWRA